MRATGHPLDLGEDFLLLKEFGATPGYCCVCVCVCVCYDVNVAFISVKSAASEDSCGIPNIIVFMTAHAGMVKVR